MSIYFLVTAILCLVLCAAALRARYARSSWSSGAAALSKTILRHVAAFSTAWLIFNLGFYFAVTGAVRPDPAGSLREKLASYREHASDFNLIFVGDSRTYCAMHPDILDSYLGTRSINLARWGHWFPTQYAQFRDLLPLLPEETGVVWSIGHENFQPVNEKVNINYPIGIRNLPAYLAQGYGLVRLSDNLLRYNPGLNLIGWLPRLREELDTRLERVIWSSSAGGGGETALTASLRTLIADYVEHPLTAEWEILEEEARITSIAIYKKNGAYSRVELDPDFFRRKQRESLQEQQTYPPTVAAGFEAAPEYWNQFVAILDLFREHHVKLVVNELEEAPHQYGTPAVRAAYRRFMREVVEPEVRQHGFDYVRVDFDRLSDEDYFDYNHLNDLGIDKYSAMLAENLRPHFMAD